MLEWVGEILELLAYMTVKTNGLKNKSVIPSNRAIIFPEGQNLKPTVKN